MRPRRGRYQKTHERREKLLALLKDGRRIHGAKLREAVMPGRSENAFYLLLKGMREDGYDIRADGPGHCCRGFHLVTAPQSHAA